MCFNSLRTGNSARPNLDRFVLFGVFVCFWLLFFVCFFVVCSWFVRGLFVCGLFMCGLFVVFVRVLCRF